jgi:general secretion pathway protein I
MVQNSFARQQSSAKLAPGFTLVEVLIALLLLAIALFAMLRTTLISSYQTLCLQDRTIATWVAVNVINQTRWQYSQSKVTINKLGSMVMYHQVWQWRIYLCPTISSHIYAITVQVRKGNTSSILSSLSSFVYLS